MNTHDCPKWSGCSAPICPLDSDWAVRVQLEGERVCFWLGEVVKPGGSARVGAVLGGELAEAIANLQPEMIARHGPLRRRLRQTAKTPSRLHGKGV